MKPGDLVRLSAQGKQFPSSSMLYGGDTEVPWNSNGSLIYSDLTFEPHEVGVVLKVNQEKDRNQVLTYVKILSPRGIGWLFGSYLEAVG